MPDTINLEARKLLDETAREFILFMEEKEIIHEQEYDRRELWEKFAEVDEHNKPTRSGFHWLKQATFTKWLRLWAQYRPEMAGYREYRSGGKDKTRFFYNEPVTPDNLATTATSVSVVLFPGKSSKCAAPVVGQEGTPF